MDVDFYPAPEEVVRRLLDDAGQDGHAGAAARIRAARREVEAALAMALVLEPALREAGRGDLADAVQGAPLRIDLDTARALLRAAVAGAGPGMLDRLMERPPDEGRGGPG